MTGSRLPLLDALKGLGCLAIVLHHLAFYGPMSDVVHAAAPLPIDWLYDRARLAVQVFLVLGGFLAAASLAPDGRPVAADTLALAWRRYRRLVPPLLFAVALAALITAVARPWFAHESLSAPPTLGQLLAHALLLHDLLDLEALSAGVWYVAIDFQLFVLAALLALLARRAWAASALALPLLVVLLAATSLFYFNLDPAWQAWAPYFFGAYGLGMLARWSALPRLAPVALPAIAVLGTAALWMQQRDPIAVAVATALPLAVVGRRDWLSRWSAPAALTWLGERSYSIFLIHYGIVIGFNALWHALFPTGAGINAAGMLAATLASIAAGATLHRYVESRPAALGLNATTALLVALLVAIFVVEGIAPRIAAGS